MRSRRGAQTVFRQRKAMVEPVFSALRQQQGLSRFRRRACPSLQPGSRCGVESLLFFMGSLLGMSGLILSMTEKDRNYPDELHRIVLSSKSPSNYFIMSC